MALPRSQKGPDVNLGNLEKQVNDFRQNRLDDFPKIIL